MSFFFKKKLIVNLNFENKKRSFINKIQMSMCPTETCSTNNLVIQEIQFKVNIQVTEGKRGNVILSIEKEGTFEIPKYKLNAISDSNEENIKYVF